MPPAMKEKTFERLPTSVVPKKYNLTYDRVDLENFEFAGSVVINVDVVEPVSFVRMNALDLWIKSAQAALPDGTVVKATGVDVSFEHQTVQLTFDDDLPVGPADLTVVFQGVLGDNMAGFYRSTYTLHGEPRVMAVTQFEATDARRALPCWDEPAIKAVFEVTMTAPGDRLVVSNTPVLECSTLDNGKLKRWHFAETPIMSTYLLAFVVGDFDCVSATNEDGVVVTVYTPPGKAHQGRFALDVGVKCLAYYTRQFGIAYPLAKYDMLAIPDFAAGAMENWGCVTFRETALLIDDSSSALMKQRVATVVTHEAAHMWFGNLVTMQWWNELALNEGFATFAQYMAAHAIFPDWGIWTQAVVTRVVGGAMDLDALASSHPVEVPVHHPDEIDEVFDHISYLKGCSVIRMLSETLGEDVFMRALNIYLTRHSYNNAHTADLWRACEEASGLPVAPMMATWWTQQMGFPVLNVSDAGEVSQKRFYTNTAEADPEEGFLWHVPLKATTAGGLVNAGLLTTMTDGSLLAELASSGSWFKLNAEQTGFFRVNYSPTQWQALGGAFASLSDADQIGLLADCFALGNNGELPITQALQLVRSVPADANYAVWSKVSDNLTELAGLYAHQEWMDTGFRAYLRQTYSPAYELLGWDATDADGHNTMLLRNQTIALLSIGRHEGVIEEALRRFNAYVADSANVLPPDLRATVFNIAVSRGGADAWNKVRDLHGKADLAEERLQLLAALGKTKDQALLRRTLDMALNGEVRDQDIYIVVGAVANNSLGTRMCWDWYVENWDVLVDRFANGSFLFGRIAKYSIEGFSTTDDEAMINAFFDGRELYSAPRAIANALEAVRSRASRLQRDAAEVGSWLAAQSF